MTLIFFLFYPYVSKAKSHEIWGPYRVSEKFGERVTGGVGKFTYPPPWIGLIRWINMPNFASFVAEVSEIY